MPIKVTCPGCNVTLRVPDTAAGKKIKCPKCGVGAQVPTAEDGEGADRPKLAAKSAKPAAKDREDEEERPRRRRGKRQTSANKGLWLGLGIGGGVLVLIAGVVIAIFSMGGSGADVADAGKSKTKQGKQKDQQPEPPVVAKPGGAGPGPIERTASLKNLSEIGKAWLNYEVEVKYFPMSTVGGQGKLSWRVAILPFIEQRPLHSKFKLDESWDSEHNLNVLKQYPMPTIFEPARTKPGEDNKKTYYQLFTGPGTCYPTPETKLRMASLIDRSTRTVLIAEGKNAIEWTRPDELEVKDGKLPGLGGVFGGDFFVMCADGKPHVVRRNDFSAEQMMALINPLGEMVEGWPPD